MRSQTSAAARCSSASPMRALSSGLSRDVAKRGEDVGKALEDYEREIRTRLREALKDNLCYSTRLATIFGMQLVVIDVQRSAGSELFRQIRFGEYRFHSPRRDKRRMSPSEIRPGRQRRPIYT